MSGKKTTEELFSYTLYMANLFTSTAQTMNVEIYRI
jgi:hypothetical protein